VIQLTAVASPGALLVDTLLATCPHATTYYRWHDGRPSARRLAVELHAAETGCSCVQAWRPPYESGERSPDSEVQRVEAPRESPTEAPTASFTPDPTLKARIRLKKAQFEGGQR
jgi:hypothetical protein